jgi:hypothetical protein
VTGPSSNPRGERLVTRVETVFVPRAGEHYDDDPAALADVEILPEPARVNRANRRAAARRKK